MQYKSFQYKSGNVWQQLRRITFAVRHIGGTIKVSGGVPWAGDAVVLSKLRLVGSCWAADTAVGAGVVVMSRSTVH